MPAVRNGARRYKALHCHDAFSTDWRDAPRDPDSKPVPAPSLLEMTGVAVMPSLSRRAMLYGSAANLALTGVALGQVRLSPNGRGATADSRPAPPPGPRRPDTDWRH